MVEISSATSADKKNIESALDYAAVGWKIFPAPPDSKKSHKSAKRSDGRNWGMTSDADALTVARGVELREKRKAARRTQFDAGHDEPWLLDARIGRFHLSRPHGASCFMLWYAGAHLRMGHPANYPLLHDVYHLAMREEPFGKQIWDWACSGLSDVMRQSLNEKLADPTYQVAERIKIWTEVGKKPPGPIPSQPITGDETHVA